MCPWGWELSGSLPPPAPHHTCFWASDVSVDESYVGVMPSEGVCPGSRSGSCPLGVTESLCPPPAPGRCLGARRLLQNQPQDQGRHHAGPKVRAVDLASLPWGPASRGIRAGRGGRFPCPGPFHLLGLRGGLAAPFGAFPGFFLCQLPRGGSGPDPHFCALQWWVGGLWGGRPAADVRPTSCLPSLPPFLE